jgi:hypothetical protein
MSKTILLGFPKSGTTSFQELFIKLNRTTAHWRFNQASPVCEIQGATHQGGFIGKHISLNKEKGNPLLMGLEHYDDITQMDVCINSAYAYWPQLTDFKQLYTENPERIFVLNKRDPHKILNSFKKWVFRGIGFDERMRRYNPELLVEAKGRSDDEKIINLIKGHYLKVEEFFSETNPAQLISFDIEKDTTEKLIPIDPAIKNFDFPRSNRLLDNHVYQL